ncbi:acetyltransferase [Desulfosporosinus acidiphilus SJ4]|uniref:Acetyltransferase n=1 Tax=Desulfosporosinus acidiphilus (strain DSM 22704 / JCM 16185 / SJ4) TaxID=646529 RepID=I4D5H9_DESAJ|nr:GNAT family N-acetyltransferase [Desulfosporosinus acidiphilus]AFM41053.1 acetyltransferase [Desulfosporosinus acidiphilus SJ4]
MADVHFVEGSAELLDKVGLLWKKLNIHHQTISTHFRDSMALMTFDQRKASWLSRTESGQLRVDIAVLREPQEPIGYCVTTIDNNMGEIESLFVDEAYRKMGSGTVLMERALNWLEQNSITKKRLNVAVGNEQVLNFYRRFGFQPRAIILEQRLNN